MALSNGKISYNIKLTEKNLCKSSLNLAKTLIGGLIIGALIIYNYKNS